MSAIFIIKVSCVIQHQRRSFLRLHPLGFEFHYLEKSTPLTLCFFHFLVKAVIQFYSPHPKMFRFLFKLADVQSWFLEKCSGIK